jgi:hypothetical protein
MHAIVRKPIPLKIAQNCYFNFNFEIFDFSIFIAQLPSAVYIRLCVPAGRWHLISPYWMFMTVNTGDDRGQMHND